MSNYPTLPSELLPADGRFGCGPSKVRPAQLDALTRGATSIIGTSHRQLAVKDVVGEVREGLVSSSASPMATRLSSPSAAQPPFGTRPPSA